MLRRQAVRMQRLDAWPRRLPSALERLLVGLEGNTHAHRRRAFRHDHFDALLHVRRHACVPVPTWAGVRFSKKFAGGVKHGALGMLQTHKTPPRACARRPRKAPCRTTVCRSVEAREMEPSGLGAGGLLIEQGEPVMVSVSKSAMRLGLATR